MYTMQDILDYLADSRTMALETITGAMVIGTGLQEITNEDGTFAVDLTWGADWHQWRLARDEVETESAWEDHRTTIRGDVWIRRGGGYMKISTLIATLQSVLKRDGDLEVHVDDGHVVYVEVEYLDHGTPEIPPTPPACRLIWRDWASEAEEWYERQLDRR